MGIFTLQPEGPANRFNLVVEPELCVGAPHLRFMFGGTTLAAVITAIERCTQRPVIWTTAQYLSHASPGTVLDIQVTLGLVGRYNTQAQATGRVGDRVVVEVIATLGTRSHDISAQWVVAPKVLTPEQCREDFFWPTTAASLRQMLEIRYALPGLDDDEQIQNGRVRLWIRSREGFPIDSALLAIFADFTTAGIHETLGKGNVGNSLDNTLRICRLVPTRWVCCDIQIHGAHAGFAHGDMRLFAQTGELLAIASQSMVLRETGA